MHGGLPHDPARSQLAKQADTVLLFFLFSPDEINGLFARVGIEDYGPGKVRPHERTHPGPKEDRLRLTRATKANLSPIFSLFDDPAVT